MKNARKRPITLPLPLPHRLRTEAWWLEEATPPPAFTPTGPEVLRNNAERPNRGAGT